VLFLTDYIKNDIFSTKLFVGIKFCYIFVFETLKQKNDSSKYLYTRRERRAFGQESEVRLVTRGINSVYYKSIKPFSLK
jgi:hypothetical protein